MLCSEIARAREENPYRITYEPITDALGYKFYVHDLVPPDLWLMVGDCVHNVRASLEFYPRARRRLATLPTTCGVGCMFWRSGRAMSLFGQRRDKRVA